MINNITELENEIDEIKGEIKNKNRDLGAAKNSLYRSKDGFRTEWPVNKNIKSEDISEIFDLLQHITNIDIEDINKIKKDIVKYLLENGYSI